MSFADTLAEVHVGLLSVNLLLLRLCFGYIWPTFFCLEILVNS